MKPTSSFVSLIPLSVFSCFMVSNSNKLYSTQEDCYYVYLKRINNACCLLDSLRLLSLHLIGYILKIVNMMNSFLLKMSSIAFGLVVFVIY